MAKIGNLHYLQGELKVEWKIKHFFSLSDAYYESPEFYFYDSPWMIRLLPIRETSKQLTECVGLYLRRNTTESSVTLDYSLTFKSADRKDLTWTVKSKVFDEHCTIRGIKNFAPRSLLMIRKSDLFPSNELTVICNLKICDPDVISINKSVQTESYLNTDVSMESLFKDFSGLLDSGPDHDAEIKCGELSIKAHKIIMGARSQVFKAMLQSDMVEGRTGVIEIKDMDSHHLHDFVRYLYTGSLPEVTFEKAKTLYEAGDKYAVRSLVIKCSEYMQNNLTRENSCVCLALADSHSDQELKNKVISYILSEKVFLQDYLWLPFSEKHPFLSNEVYRLSYKAANAKNT